MIHCKTHKYHCEDNTRKHIDNVATTAHFDLSSHSSLSTDSIHPNKLWANQIFLFHYTEKFQECFLSQDNPDSAGTHPPDRQKTGKGSLKYFRANNSCVLCPKSVFRNAFMTIFALLAAKAWASDGHPWSFTEWSYSLSTPTVMWMLEWWWAGPGSRPRHKLDWH